MTTTVPSCSSSWSKSEGQVGRNHFSLLQSLDFAGQARLCPYLTASHALSFPCPPLPARTSGAGPWWLAYPKPITYQEWWEGENGCFLSTPCPKSAGSSAALRLGGRFWEFCNLPHSPFHLLLYFIRIFAQIPSRYLSLSVMKPSLNSQYSTLFPYPCLFPVSSSLPNTKILSVCSLSVCPSEYRLHKGRSFTSFVADSTIFRTVPGT